MIIAHLVAISVAALPRVNKAALSKSARQSPTARAEIDAWTQRIASWGVDIDPEMLEQSSLRILESWLEVRTFVNTPFRPYIRLFGLEQPWMLFSGADRFPTRMIVEIEREGAWQPLQSMYPITSDWRAPLLRHSRVHGVVYSASWPVHRRRYDELGRWLARQAAHEFPGATRLRISIEGTRMLSPEEVREGVVAEVATRQRRTFELEGFR